MANDEKIKQIGYMPTTIENEKINVIADAYRLTRVNVIRNLIYNHLTLDELYKLAQGVLERRGDDDVIDMSDYLTPDYVIM